MKPPEYKKLCQELGTHAKVAGMLGVNPSTLYRRFEGRVQITQETVLALTFLVNCKNSEPLRLALAEAGVV